MKPKIYLAGPDVFLWNARSVGERKQALCRDYGFDGLFPLDTDDAVGTDAAAIFQANCVLMRQADIGLLNLSPFRGASADAGTVFELGFLFSLDKPVFGYSSATALYRDRVAALSGVVVDDDGFGRDPDGFAVEDFGLCDNLMIARAIAESRGAVTTIAEEAGAEPDLRLSAFRAFTASLKLMRERFAELAL